jgi:AcrR family transcriptional regulator
MDRHPTQQKILDETIRIIETSGESSVRVHDIEVAVNVTAPSIYHFFGSREGLVSAAQAERVVRSFSQFNEVSESILSRVSSRAELRAAVDQILTMIYDPSRVTARLQRIFALASAEGRPELATLIGDEARSFLHQNAIRFSAFQEQGWIRPDLDLEAFSQWLAGQILGRIYIELGCEPTANPAWDAISKEAVAFVVFGSLSDE